MCEGHGTSASYVVLCAKRWQVSLLFVCTLLLPHSSTFSVIKCCMWSSHFVHSWSTWYWSWDYLRTWRCSHVIVIMNMWPSLQHVIIAMRATYSVDCWGRVFPVFGPVYNSVFTIVNLLMLMYDWLTYKVIIIVLHSLYCTHQVWVSCDSPSLILMHLSSTWHVDLTTLTFGFLTVHNIIYVVLNGLDITLSRRLKTVWLCCAWAFWGLVIFTFNLITFK